MNDLILKAYEALGTETPLKFDCGLICNKKCCKGGFCELADSGMLLLPHEKNILKAIDTFKISENKDGDFLFCNGYCERENRPFACRIFPYYAKFEEKLGRIKLSILPDERAKTYCPIIFGAKPFRKNIYFERNLKKAIRILMKDNEIFEELTSISRFIESISQLRKRMFSRKI